MQLGRDVRPPRRLHERERDLTDAVDQDADREPAEHRLAVCRVGGAEPDVEQLAGEEDDPEHDREEDGEDEAERAPVEPCDPRPVDAETG